MKESPRRRRVQLVGTSGAASSRRGSRGDSLPTRPAARDATRAITRRLGTLAEDDRQERKAGGREANVLDLREKKAAGEIRICDADDRAAARILPA